MYVEEINVVKSLLGKLKDKKLINQWELPYENLLTRLDAALFFVDMSVENKAHLSKQFSTYHDFKLEDNTSNLSKLPYQITFKKEQK